MDAPDALDAVAARGLRRLAQAGVEWPDAALPALQALAIASDFAIDTLVRQPTLLQALLADAATPLPPPELAPGAPDSWPGLLRRYRAAQSTRLVWRDVVEAAPVAEILAGSTALAEDCLRLALAACEDAMAARFGTVHDAQGRPQRLVVFGLGKLGGGELNFSSDIDIVYAYPDEGESDGARTLAAQDYFARLGRQLAKLLDEVTADGFCHRVDLRLRPHGGAGRLAWSFPALEAYFQREGRDWERYAWQKARPVAGDIRAGEDFLETLRPFVYRRYLDFGAIEGMRAMKDLISAEVARRELADDIKRGPGGIREIEFLVQVMQLIRGGREPALQRRGLRASLAAVVAGGLVPPATGEMLGQAYDLLRTVENRLQMRTDAQVHALPQDARERARLAHGLGADWPALAARLDGVRAQVGAEFDALLARPRAADSAGALADYWRALPERGDAQSLAAAGFGDVRALDGALRDFARAPGVRELSDATRARLDRVLPALLQAAADSAQPDRALQGVLALLHNILRRTSYLALLDEAPGALARLVDVVARSALLADRVAAHPLLLDELLDARALGVGITPADAIAACDAALERADGDPEAALRGLAEARQLLSFRVALAALDARQPPQDSACQLAWLADAVIAAVLQVAQVDVAAAHGRVPGARFAVLGYGSLGARELGFGSDLDLVFLFDGPEGAESDGRRPLEAGRYFARLAQKIVAMLGTPTPAGKLYEVDVRLRPDGAKGLLVSSLAAYARYQHERAWTWEHQALVRARCVTGDPGLCATFGELRAGILQQPRAEAGLREQVAWMRERLRTELDRSDALRMDLKQGSGGLTDLEFALQYLVLRDAATQSALASVDAGTPALLQALRDAGALDADRADALLQAHAGLLDAGLRCTLDRRQRLVPRTGTIDAAAGLVEDLVHGLGLDAGAPAQAS